MVFFTAGIEEGGKAEEELLGLSADSYRETFLGERKSYVVDVKVVLVHYFKRTRRIWRK